MAVTSESMDQQKTEPIDSGGDAEVLHAQSAEPEVSPVRPARKRLTKSNGTIHSIDTQDPSQEPTPSQPLKPEDAKRPYDISIPYKSKWRYPDLLAQIFIHVGGVYGLYLLLTRGSLYTFLWVFGNIYVSAVGVTAGAHRLWSHKAYQANLPLRILLAWIFTMSGQRHIYVWALDHRVHHRFTETDADPHDARRGFFFAHVGWLVLTPHPAVEKERKLIDMSDLDKDMVVVWHRRLYVPLFAIFCIIFPVGVPYYFWNENLWVAFWVCFNMRFSVILNLAFLVNSAAHMFGNRPYDKSILSTENPTLSAFVIGEGWHNYHHVFPWDYRAGELGQGRLNITTNFIDLMARIGWVRNRRKASPDMIVKRAASYGDGSARHDVHNLAAVASS